MTEPRATYRLQLHAGFRFADAAAAVPYLAELGISHLYLSPILTAAEGSTHGYDVVDPERISDELGGEAGFARLARTAHAAGLGILLDIVPNHMSIAGRRNRWWFDVLENGPASYYAHYFDVDWTTGDDRVLLPVLAERYGRALQNGAIRVAMLADGRFVVRAGELELPIAPRALGTLVGRAGERAYHGELAFVGDALASLPAPDRREHEARRRRHRDRAVLLGRLAELARDPGCAAVLAAEVAAVNSDPAELDALLEAQAYRLAHWSVAGSQLSYRRFFDINTLVALRNEEPDVFDASHERLLRLVADGEVDGLRVDHVDGLRDPAAYLSRLRVAAPGAWIVVEKILAADETLPASWPVDGTTGYEIMDKLGGLFVDPAGEDEMTRAFIALTGEHWQPIVASRRARLAVMSDALHSELARLTELAVRACWGSPSCRDYTHAEIESALAELLAGYPTYRTYGSEAEQRDVDRARIAAAAAAACDARGDLDRHLVGFLASALGFELAGDAARELAYSAQQVTGAITAKGDEDTTLYRQVRLLSRCEVGSALRTFAYPVDHVHHALASSRPHTLIATSTHDSKRGEDVRARIAVLSEIPARWAGAVSDWRTRADRYWQVDPDRVIEYLLWQTLVGAHPLSIERAREYARKAAREARLRTSWRRPDAHYEAALAAWLDGVYGDVELCGELARFAAEIAPHGARNSLAQVLIKLVAPGVADFYQGCELVDDSLVDPDNRRPVDLARRHAELRVLESAQPELLAGDLSATKLWTVRRVLGVRRKQPGWFAGAYSPFRASGPHADRVFAFGRGDRVIAIAPRLGVAADGWRDTTIEVPDARWRDVLSDQTFSGGVLALRAIWRVLPIALLIRVD